MKLFFLFLGLSAAAWGGVVGSLEPTLYPRTDLNVVVGGIPLEPGMGLTSWTAMVPLSAGKEGRAGDTLALGEMVLLEEEVPQALAELKGQAFQVEIAQGDLLNGSPSIKRLYFKGRGSRTKMKEAVRVLGAFLTKFQPRTRKSASLPSHRTTPSPSPTPNPLKSPELLWSQVEAILGPGERAGKILNYIIPRPEAVWMGGAELPANLGVGTEFHFQKVEGLVLGKKRFLGLASKAIQPALLVTGQFALKGGQMGVVEKFLREHQVEVTLIDPHWTGLTPRLFFLDFWAVGSPRELAEILKKNWVCSDHRL